MKDPNERSDYEKNNTTDNTEAENMETENTKTESNESNVRNLNTGSENREGEYESRENENRVNEDRGYEERGNVNRGNENRQNRKSEERSTYSSKDIEKNKAIAALAYIIFFLPLLAAQDSPYARFHGNQGLLLFILGFGGNIILTVIPIIGWILIPFFSLFVIVLAVMGILNAINGRAKDLPLIGHFRILN